MSDRYYQALVHHWTHNSQNRGGVELYREPHWRRFMPKPPKGLAWLRSLFRYLAGRVRTVNVTARLYTNDTAAERSTFQWGRITRKMLNAQSTKIADSWGRIARDLTALVGIRTERVRDRHTRPLTPRDAGRFGGGMYERPWIEFEWEMRGEYDGSQLARDNRRRFREQQLADFKSGKIQTLQFS